MRLRVPVLVGVAVSGLRRGGTGGFLGGVAGGRRGNDFCVEMHGDRDRARARAGTERGTRARAGGGGHGRRD